MIFMSSYASKLQFSDGINLKCLSVKPYYLHVLKKIEMAAKLERVFNLLVIKHLIFFIIN